ncbi:MAG: molybdopterin-dependent oxidoreductase [Thermoanaerobaculia bacterium]
MSDHRKHARFKTVSREPFNGEPPPELLVRSRATPANLFYVRNHAPVPQVDPDRFRLEVGGMVRRPLHLALGDLRRRFPQAEVEATLQCAGNRRREMARVRPIPGEEPWDLGAVSNAVWRGVPLAAVLEAAGLDDGAAHVAFDGLDRVEVEKGGEALPFGGSIPLGKAREPGVLLAWEMNGEPLPPDHGFPLRVVVPGYIAARSVKWLGAIRVQAEPSENFYQQRAYKLFPPEVGPEDADWEAAPMLGELSVTSAICRPADAATVLPGRVAVEGYALGGNGQAVAAVELSTDGGATWQPARHEEAPPGVWTLWRAEVELPEGEHELVCRARDSGGAEQPEGIEGLWNFKGYMNTARHRVRVRCG